MPMSAVVVAYGLILPKPILDAPRLGCLNLHGSLLPRWRGAAPIQRAVMAGDARTGVMVMQMDEGLDTGPVGLVEEMPIGPDMTSGELHDKMMLVGADLMGRALAALERGSLTSRRRPTKASPTRTRSRRPRPASTGPSRRSEVHNLIRGLSPFPGAWFELELGGTPTRIKALRSTLADGQGAPGTHPRPTSPSPAAPARVRLTAGAARRQGRHGRRDLPARRGHAAGTGRASAALQDSPSNMTARPSAAGSGRPTP